MDKKNLVYMGNGILFTLNEKEILPFTTSWMNLGEIILNDLSQTQKENNISWFYYTWNIIRCEMKDMLIDLAAELI